MTTEADTTGWSDLNTYTTTALLSHLDHLRKERAYRQAANLIMEVRAYELRIAAAERMLAIHNRRATEAEDQRAAARGKLDPALCRRLASVLRAPLPDCTCTGWFEVDHEIQCARRQHRAAIGEAMGILPLQLEAAAEMAIDWGPLLELAAADLAERPPLTEERVRAAVLAAVDEAAYQPDIGKNSWSLAFTEWVADRAAKELADRAVSAEQHVLLQSAGERIAELETQREADLREAFRAGYVWWKDRWPDDPNDPDAAAAEYARSKAGG